METRAALKDRQLAEAEAAAGTTGSPSTSSDAGPERAEQSVGTPSDPKQGSAVPHKNAQPASTAATPSVPADVSTGQARFAALLVDEEPRADTDARQAGRGTPMRAAPDTIGAAQIAQLVEDAATRARDKTDAEALARFKLIGRRAGTGASEKQILEALDDCRRTATSKQMSGDRIFELFAIALGDNAAAHAELLRVRRKSPNSDALEIVNALLTALHMPPYGFGPLPALKGHGSLRDFADALTDYVERASIAQASGSAAIDATIKDNLAASALAHAKLSARKKLDRTLALLVATTTSLQAFVELAEHEPDAPLQQPPPHRQHVNAIIDDEDDGALLPRAKIVRPRATKESADNVGSLATERTCGACHKPRDHGLRACALLLKVRGARTDWNGCFGCGDAEHRMNGCPRLNEARKAASFPYNRALIMHTDQQAPPPPPSPSPSRPTSTPSPPTPSPSSSPSAPPRTQQSPRQHTTTAPQLMLAADGDVGAMTATSSSTRQGRPRAPLAQTRTEQPLAPATPPAPRQPKAHPLHVAATIGRHRLAAMLDTGASVSLVTADAAREWGLVVQAGTERTLITADRRTFATRGHTCFALNVGGTQLWIDALVVDKLSTRLLLGMAQLWRQPKTPLTITNVNGELQVRFGQGAWVRATQPHSSLPIVFSVPADLPTPRAPTLDEHVDDDGNRWLYDDEPAREWPDSIAFVTLADDDSGRTIAGVIEGEGLIHAPRDATRPDDAHAMRLPQLDADAPVLNTDAERPRGADRIAHTLVKINEQLSAPLKARIRAKLSDYADRFGATTKDGAPTAPPQMKGVVHRIVLRHDADLSRVAAGVRRLGTEEHKATMELVDRLTAEGRLRPTNSPVASAPIVVAKKDAYGKFTGWRVAIDFRRLNEQCLGDPYPMPFADATAEWLSTFPYRSSFDGWSMFWQVGLDAHSSKLTATVFAPGVAREWTVAPFGLRTLPATLQRIMDATFDALNMRSYMDDLFVGHCDEQSILADLDDTLRRARARGIVFKASKCCVGFDELPALGFLVGNGTRRPVPEKTQPLVDYGTPRNTTMLKTFMHGVTYYMNFLPGCADTMGPLRELAQHRGPFAWQQQHQDAFDQLKRQLALTVALAPLTVDGKLVLDTDFAQHGVGWVLSQRNASGAERPITMGSQRLDDTQKRYPPTKGELHALRVAVSKLRDRLIGRHFEWRTDHLPLETINTKAISTSPWIRNTLAELQEYSFTPVHRDGTAHANADMLSRDPRFVQDNAAAAATLAACDVRLQGDTAAIVDDAIDENNDAEDDEQSTRADSRHTDVQSLVDNARADTSSAAPHMRDAVGDDDSDETSRDTRAIPPAPAELPVDKMIRLQHADSTLAHMWTVAEGGVPPTNAAELAPVLAAQPYVNEHGLLCVAKPNGGLVVVPAGAKLAILHNFHSADGACHISGAKCLARLRQSYWWRTMARDMMEFAKHCVPCQMAREVRQPGNLGDELADARKLELWVIDLTGPYAAPLDTATPYAFTAIDVATGYVVLEALPNKSADAVAAAFRRRLLRFGVPRAIIADSGTEFDNATLQAVCGHLGTDIKFNAAYDTKARGHVERMHRTLHTMLAKRLADGNGKSLVDELSVIELALNSMASRPRGVSPFFAMFGQEALTPMEVFLRQAAPGASTGSADEIARATARACGEAIEHAEQMRAADHARNAVAYAAHHGAEVNWQVGEECWLWVPRDTKLASRVGWTGPWIVSKVLEHGLHVHLRARTGHGSAQPISIRRLKPYFDPTKVPLAVPELGTEDSFDYNIDLTRVPWLAPRSEARMLTAEIQRRLRREAEVARKASEAAQRRNEQSAAKAQEAVAKEQRRHERDEQQALKKTKADERAKRKLRRSGRSAVTNPRYDDGDTVQQTRDPIAARAQRANRRNDASATTPTAMRG